jgi:hypothetical protein
VAWGFDDQEEFFAIVVENIYMSEKGKTVFRANHGDKTMQDSALKPWIDNATFRGLFDKLRRQQKALYEEIEAVPASFNPIAQYEATALLY